MSPIDLVECDTEMLDAIEQYERWQHAERVKAERQRQQRGR